MILSTSIVTFSSLLWLPGILYILIINRQLFSNTDDEPVVMVMSLISLNGVWIGRIDTNHGELPTMYSESNAYPSLKLCSFACI